METRDLQDLAIELKEYLKLSFKSVLTMEEAASYLGMSKSNLYKLTSARLIAYSKPMGKQIYFERSELEKWCKRNRVAPLDEIESNAATYMLRQTMG